MTLKGTSRQQKRVSETKRTIAHAVLYWKELIPFYQGISRIIFTICFQELTCPVRQPNRYILEILLAYKYTFVDQNHWANVRLNHCRGPKCLCLSKLFTCRSHVSADSTRLSPSCETWRILMKMVYMYKIHTLHTENKITLERVS